MRRFDNLRIADVALDIAELTYRATQDFPRDERFGLTSQMRRAAVSIGSNIAEGAGRSTAAQFLHFLQISAGSVSELEFQISVARRLTFGNAEELERLRTLVQRERRMLGTLSTRIRAST